MTETTASAGSAELQKTTAAFFSSIFHTGPEPVLKAQADLLASAETTVSGWLRRRHEAVQETQALVARLRGSTDPAELAAAQQEWVSATLRRMAAEATAYQTAALDIVERARTWIPAASDATDGAAGSNGDAGKSSGRALRTANKAAE